MTDRAGRRPRPAGAPTRLRDELRDFFYFVRRPRLSPRLPGGRAGGCARADWLAGLDPGRLLQWALLLWLCNLAFLGPLAVAAAEVGGAQHRLNIHRIPWLHALLWAPLVEELVFRYGLRRIGQALWLVPAAVCALLFGPQWSTGLLVAGILLALWAQEARGGFRPAALRLGQPSRSGATQRAQVPWRLRRQYRQWFPWVFYTATSLFAVVHLHNFDLNRTPLWLLPLLVLPQWVTGLVLGWTRVRRGIGAAVLLHAIFNGGPLLLIWLVLSWMPEMAAG